MKKIVALSIFLCFNGILYSQETPIEEKEPVEEIQVTEESQEIEEPAEKQKKKSILPIRIGIKAGIPNGIGGGLEYVTPLLKSRISIYADYSGLSAEIDEVDSSLKYLEIGTNIYFKGNKGSGLYASFSYGDFSMEGNFDNYETDDGEILTDGYGEFEASTLNVKLGLKAGKRFYFRTELGYGFGTIPQEIEVTGKYDGVEGIELIDISEIPGMSESGYVIFNIGFGIAF